MSPPVSVVVPSFNNAAHIEATMRSILAQSYDDFELIVSDHGSSDDTWQRLQQFAGDPRVTLVQIAPGGGAERNWNHVTSMASGDLLKLVCGDDVLHPDCLARQVEAFRAAGDQAVLVASRRDLVDTHGRTIAKARGMGGLTGLVDGREAIRQTILSGTNIFGEPACVMFRRPVLEAVGGWDGADGYVIDVATYIRVLELGDLVALPESLASFRISGGQWSVRLQRDQTRQVTTLFRAAAERSVGTVSRADVLRGSAMTRVRSLQRRAAYKVLARRM